MATPPATPRYAWLIAAVSFFGCAAVDGLCNSYGLLYEGVQLRYAGTSRSRVVLAGSLMSGCFMLFGPISSAFVRRFGNRCCMIFGSLVTTVSMIIAARWTRSIGMFIMFYGVLAGCGLSFIFMPSMLAVTEYFDEKKRSIALGLACAGGGAGVLMMAPLVSWLLKIYVWSDAVTILSGVVLQCVVLGALMRPTNTLKISTAEHTITTSNLSIVIQRDSDIENIALNIDKKLPEVKALLDSLHAHSGFSHASSGEWVFVDYSFLVIAGSSCAVQMAYYVPLMFIGDYARSLDANVSTNQIANIFVVFGITNTIGRLLGGFLSNQKRVNLLHLYSTSLVLAGILTAVTVTLATTIVHVSWYFAFLGLFTAIFVPTSTCLLIDYLSLEKLSKGFGWLSVVRGVSSMFGAPLAGFILDCTSSYEAAFYFSAVLFIIGGVTVYGLPGSRRKMRKYIQERLSSFPQTNNNALNANND